MRQLLNNKLYSFQLYFELKLEQKNGTLLASSCCTFEKGVRNGQTSNFCNILNSEPRGARHVWTSSFTLTQLKVEVCMHVHTLTTLTILLLLMCCLYLLQYGKIPLL